MIDKRPGVEVYAVNRDEEFDFIVEHFDEDTRAATPWDLSAVTYSVRIRAATRPLDTNEDPDVDVELPKVTSGADGRVRGFARFPTKRSLLECEVVVVDTTSNNAATLTGKREVRVRWWDARVEGALAAPTP